MNRRVALLLLVAGTLVPTSAVAESTAEPVMRVAPSEAPAPARYPHWSRALAAGAADPVVDARVPMRRSRLGPDGTGPRLTAWASTVAAQPGDRVALFAMLTPVAAPGLFSSPALTGAHIVARLFGERVGPLGTVTFRDNGTAPDALARDGIYTAVIALPEDPDLPLGAADEVKVDVTATLPNDARRQVTGAFQLGRPTARLTGRYTDAVRNGNLVIAAQVEALAPGPVELSGTLADSAGTPFATAQAARSLAEGTHWVELPFYGLAFHDRGVSGPVQLASIALASTGSAPAVLGALVEGAHRTQDYALDQFTARLFDDPGLREAARRLRLDLKPIASLPRQ